MIAAAGCDRRAFQFDLIDLIRGEREQFFFYSSGIPALALVIRHLH
jgi:hypothetical protein